MCFSRLRLNVFLFTLQVSKSWKSLADDDWLWWRLSGENESVTVDRVNWKHFVKQKTIDALAVVNNWKVCPSKWLHRLTEKLVKRPFFALPSLSRIRGRGKYVYRYKAN